MRIRHRMAKGVVRDRDGLVSEADRLEHDATATSARSTPGPSRPARWPRRLERLQAAIIDAERKLSVLRARNHALVDIERCSATIERARDAAGVNDGWLRRRRRPYVAWDCLAQFDREVVHLLEPAELVVLWKSVKAEADEKLKDHRKKAAETLVADPPTVDHLTEVMRHLHTTSQNAYHKIDRLNEQIRYAGLLLTVLVVTLLIGAYFRLGGFSRIPDT